MKYLDRDIVLAIAVAANIIAIVLNLAAMMSQGASLTYTTGIVIGTAGILATIVGRILVVALAEKYHAETDHWRRQSELAQRMQGAMDRGDVEVKVSRPN